MPCLGLCGRCGLRAPLSIFVDLALQRKFWAAYLRLPPPVQDNCLHYLGLFKPSRDVALSPGHLLRLVDELAELVASGRVSKKGAATHVCPAELWAQAMERVRERAGQLDLPLRGHGYLRAVAYALASDATVPRAPLPQAPAPEPGTAKLPTPQALQSAESDDNDDGLSPFERRYLAAHGSLPDAFSCDTGESGTDEPALAATLSRLRQILSDGENM